MTDAANVALLNGGMILELEAVQQSLKTEQIIYGKGLFINSTTVFKILWFDGTAKDIKNHIYIYIYIYIFTYIHTYVMTL